MFKKIEIKSFKKIDSIGVSLNKLGKINYLIGKNASGKSSILEAIQMYSTLTSQPEPIFKKYLESKGIDKNSSLRINNLKEYKALKENDLYDSSFADKYRNKVLKIICDPSDELYSINLFEKFNKDYLLKNENEILPLLQSFNQIRLSEFSVWQHIHYKGNIFGGNYKQFNYFEDQIRYYVNLYFPYNLLSEDRIKLEYILKGYDLNLMKYHSAINETILTNLKDKMLNSPNKKFKADFEHKINELRVKSQITSFHATSTGIHNLYSLITLIKAFKSKNNVLESHLKLGGRNIILIEEPENFINIEYQKFLPYIFHFLSKFNNNVQFFISTHSPFIINSITRLENESEFDISQSVYYIDNAKVLLTNHDSTIKSIVRKMNEIDANEFAPDKTIFCDQTMYSFLQTIHKEWYSDKDLRFISPKDRNNNVQASDDMLSKIANVYDILSSTQNIYINEVFVVMDKVNPKIYTDLHLRQKKIAENYSNLIIIDYFSFEEAFGLDSNNFNNSNNKLLNAKTQAKKLIDLGNKSGKELLFTIFPQFRLFFK